MYSGSGDKSADAAATLNDAFSFESCQCMPRSHKADFVKFGKIALRGHRIAGPKLACINALSNRRENAREGRNEMSLGGQGNPPEPVRKGSSLPGLPAHSL